MRARILRYQLLFLFLVTLLCLGHLYYQNQLPDNFSRISSSSISGNFIIYYLASALVFLNYFSGPWFVAPFIVFALIHSFIFSKRDFTIDLFLFLPLMFFFLGFFYFVAPSLMGNGLHWMIRVHLPWYATVLAVLSFGFLFCWGLWRSSFLHFLARIPGWIRKLYAFVVKSYRLSVSAGDFTKRMVSGIWQGCQKAIQRLKAQNKATRDVSNGNSLRKCFSLPVPGVEAEEASVDEIFPETTLIEDEPPCDVVDDESLNIENEETPTVAKPAAKLKKKIVAPSIPKYKFRNDELVDCITVQKKKPSFTPDEKYFTDIVSRIEEKFKEFRIEGQIINILKGPVVDTFELEMGAGVKVSKVISITEDLGLALYGAPIRMVYPLRGRTTIGIEVPRNPREIIYLDDVFRSPEFARSQARLPLVMGRDAFGNFFAEDLTNMPHMLVAGATGSGKSVFINTLLVSLLIKKSPDEMKLLLIDPKQLELALYAGLPHLLLPVVTDAQTASHSLMWACQEMERRYSILKEFGVRNIDGFNEKLPTAGRDLLCKIQGYYDDEDSSDYRLPYIVIIVDEFSDLILSKAGKAIEGNICRLAAKARAAGIHLIIATQRPSVDVVTGLIKSNFPTRVSFKVTTSIDSRTILNTIGAEKLLGNGDMLYKRGIDTFRIHSSYIGETEIETLMNKITTIPARYCSKAVDFIENGEEGERSYGGASWTGGEDSDDELFDEAVQVVTDSGLASASLLQRRLKVGYNRAANLIEIMEDKGIVGPGQGSKPRKVLISSAE